MAIDLLIAGMIVVFGLLGRRMGTIRQLTHWAGLLLARAIGKPLALIMTLTLARDAGVPPIGVRVAIAALCFYTFWILGTIIAKFFVKQYLEKRRASKADRTGGLVLGLGQGAIVIFVFLSAVVFFERPLIGAVEQQPEALRSSMALRFVRRHNYFKTPRLSPRARLQLLVDAVRRGEVETDPSVSASLQDEQLMKAIRLGDWAALQDDPRVGVLLKDPRVVGPMQDPFDFDLDDDEAIPSGPAKPDRGADAGGDHHRQSDKPGERSHD